MITKKKSSLLKTHKNTKKNKNGNDNNNSNNNISHESKTIQHKIKKFNDYYNNDYNNDPEYNSKYSIISINSNFTPSKTHKKKKKYKTFLSKVHTLRRMKRVIPIGQDNLSVFLDDYNKELKTGNIIKIDNKDNVNALNKLFFNHKID